MRKTFILIFFGTSTSACQNLELLGIGTEAVPGTIVFYGDSTTIDVPDLITAGKPFEVRFNTFGGGCLGEGARDRVSGHGNELLIRPFDRDGSNKNVVCTADLRPIRHSVRAVRDVPGPITIRIAGLRKHSGSYDGVPVALTRSVMVIAPSPP